MSEIATAIPTLIITGAVGVGKTTVAHALSDRLSERHVAHALVDLDALRDCTPSPPDDPFQIALGMRNLAAVCANYRAAGAERLILVDVVETQDQRADYAQAIPGAAIQIVRLQARLETLLRRLEGRECGDSLIWHQARAGELSALMDARQIGDVQVDTDDQSADQVADEILKRISWLS